jgi:hypothetical protein
VELGRPKLRSVDSKCAGRAIEPRKVLNAGAAVFLLCGGRAQAPQWPGVLRPAGVEEQGAFRLRFIQEPGKPKRFHDSRPAGDTGTTSPASRSGARFQSGVRKQNAQHGIASVKATKHSGRNVWDSEPPIVPVKLGNQPEGTQRREGEAGTRNRKRERWERR